MTWLRYHKTQVLSLQEKAVGTTLSSQSGLCIVSVSPWSLEGSVPAWALGINWCTLKLNLNYGSCPTTSTDHYNSWCFHQNLGHAPWNHSVIFIPYKDHLILTSKSLRDDKITSQNNEQRSRTAFFTILSQILGYIIPF